TVCPHTATALHLLDRLRAEGDARDYAVVATAHPAKFDGVIDPLIGSAVEVPASLASLLARPSRSEPLAADYSALRARLQSSV
ncbi:MAG: threonine synthase, partial [Acidobacteriota bacterium]|nr:threonine synthase [Acidobacteriota bacterium]